MVDPEKQAAFIAGLRKKAEELAANNPVFADLRIVSKTLVDEARKRVADGTGQTSIGAYLTEGKVSLIVTEATEHGENPARCGQLPKRAGRPMNVS